VSIEKAKIELEKRLVAAYPALKVAFEGYSFTPPESEPYVYCQIRIDPPDDPVIGTMYRRENISFQLFVCGVFNSGTSEALSIASDLRDLYQRGTFMSVDNLRIHIFSSPQIGGSSIVNNRVMVPVLIPVTVEVYN
jgi:hypothetical protein